MTPSEDLFLLVKSLSKAEKAHISKATQYYIRKDGNSYVKLLKEIEKQEHYDEKALKQKFKGERLLNQFWVAKNYLYNFILKSLESFHESVDAEIRSLLQQTDILLDKELYHLCEKIIKKGQRLSQHYQRQAYLLEFLKKEDYMLAARSYSTVTKEEIEELYEKMFEALRNAKTIIDYYHMRTKIYSRNMKQGMIRNVVDADLYEKTLSSPLFKNPDKIYLFEPKTTVLSTMTGYYHNIGDHKKANEMVWMRFKNYIDNPQFIRMHPIAYLGAAYDCIASSLQMKHLEKIPDLINRLKIFKPASQIEMERQYTLVCYSEVLYLYDCKKYDELKKYISTLSEERKKRNLKKNIVSITLFYNLGRISFLLGDYKTAKIYFQVVLQEFPKTLRIDYHIFSHLLLLTTYYETGKLDLIEYELKYTERFINKKERLYKTEKALIDFFRVIVAVPDDEKRLKKEYQTLEEELIESFKEPSEKNTRNYFDFLVWVRCKIKKTPILENYVM